MRALDDVSGAVATDLLSYRTAMMAKQGKYSVEHILPHEKYI